MKMIEENSMLMQRSANVKQQDIFPELCQKLEETYPVFDSSLIPNDFGYTMALHSINLEDILIEMEAFYFNYSNSDNKKTLNSNLINEWLIKSLKNRIDALMQDRNKIRGNNTRSIPTKKATIKNSMMISSTVNLKIKLTLAYPESDKYLKIPTDFNSNKAIIQFYPNYDIKEYPLIPKDEWESEDQYLKYFIKMRSFLLQKYNIKEDDPLLNISKFVLIVNFETTDTKPILKDIRLVDPLNGFEKYKIRHEKEFPLKNYLVSGQIIVVDGDFLNDEISIRELGQGFPIEIFMIDDQGLMPFFAESSPYLFYTMNGPFYSNDSINLSVYTQTLLKISESNPHCVLINGPFIHTENEQIKTGNIEMSYFALFESMIEIIDKIFKDKRATVIISPSLGDVLNYYPIPQPPFNLIEMGSITKFDIYKANRLKFISNPHIFQLNEMIIGLANFDFVKDITSNCIRMSNKSPIEVGLETVIEQKSFYPLLQNTFNSIDELKMDRMTTVDIGQYERLTFDASPDVIITSSSLNPFAKKIHSTLFVNSGGLYKGKTAGCYARIISYPPNVSVII